MLIVMLIVLTTTHAQVNCERYFARLFNVWDTTITFAQNMPEIGLSELSTSDRDLDMHLYLPMNDTLSKRPAIVFMFGGAFVAGSKDSEVMMAFCDSFARLGYVTASIDYRLGIDFTDSRSAGRAAYRATQDGRSAIRFLRHRAHILKIDTNEIYVLGCSAGGIAALHMAFLDEPAERPADANSYARLFQNVPSLGPMDIGQHLQFGGSPNAVFTISSAVTDTSIINADDDTPLFLVHGEIDVVVPFQEGSPFLGILPTFPSVHGSRLIADRRAHLGLNTGTYFEPNEGHVFYQSTLGIPSPFPSAHWPYILSYAKTFFNEQHRPSASFVASANDLEVTFTYSGTPVTQIFWDFGDGSTSSQNNPVHTYADSGTYTIVLFVVNQNGSCDTHVETIQVNATQVITESNLLKAQKTSIFVTQNHWVVNAAPLNTKFMVYDLLGKTIHQGVIKSESQNINLPILSGIYLLSLENVGVFKGFR